MKNALVLMCELSEGFNCEQSLTFVEFKFNGWTVQFLDLSSEGEPVSSTVYSIVDVVLYLVQYRMFLVVVKRS